MIYRSASTVLLLLIACGLVPTAAAADFCVASPAELTASLTAARTNHEDDIIRLVQGVYVGNFAYDSGETFDLSLLGGYTSACSSREVNAANTTLDASGSGTVLQLTATSTQADFTLDALTIRGGSATDGGGLFIESTGYVNIRNNVIEGNRAIENGGGVYLSSGLSPVALGHVTFLKNTISGNRSQGRGAGLALFYKAAIELVANVADQNTAHLEGGGASIWLGPPTTLTITGNKFTGNTAIDGGAVDIEAPTEATTTVRVTANVFRGNSVQIAGGAVREVFAVNSLYERNLFDHNVASDESIGTGGGLYVNAIKGTFTAYRNVFVDNEAGDEGGGLMGHSNFDPTVVMSSNIFLRNKAAVHNERENEERRGGGARWYIEGGSLRVENNLAAFNAARVTGGGFYLNTRRGKMSITNNTVVYNSLGILDVNGGGMFVTSDLDAAPVDLYNNIVWANVAHPRPYHLPTNGYDLFISNQFGVPFNIIANDFDQDPVGSVVLEPIPIDPSNLDDVDPQFVNVAAGDFSLAAGSPLIDKGAFAPLLPAYDIEGNPRIVNGVPDIGAYEFVPGQLP